MSTLAISLFTKFDQSAQEVYAGSSLTIDQKEFIQTQMAMIAENIIALDINTQDVNAYIQNQAFLKGQLSAYQYLLDSSKASEEALAAANPNQPI